MAAQSSGSAKGLVVTDPRALELCETRGRIRDAMSATCGSAPTHQPGPFRSWRLRDGDDGIVLRLVRARVRDRAEAGDGVNKQARCALTVGRAHRLIVNRHELHMSTRTAIHLVEGDVVSADLLASPRFGLDEPHRAIVLFGAVQAFDLFVASIEFINREL